MLARLVTGMDSSRFTNTVVSLTEIGPVGELLEKRGVPVRALGMGTLPGPRTFARLVSWLRMTSPDVVQTWLYAADLLGGLAGRLAGRKQILWNVRQAYPVQPNFAARHVWAARTCGLLSGCLPSAVVFCSEEARRSHEALGYVRGRNTVIPNGFDLRLFGRDPVASASVRAELGVGSTTHLVGMVARFDPVKGHADFFEAAALICRRRPDVHFLLCGEGTTCANRKIASWSGATELRGRVHLLGPRTDVSRLLAALDISVLASHSEGFPNAIGEAMASAVPCVVTDVGGAASLVGTTGSVVPPHSPRMLAEAVLSLLDLDQAARWRLGSAARERLEGLYSLPAMIDRYSALYESESQMHKRSPTMCPS